MTNCVICSTIIADNNERKISVHGHVFDICFKCNEVLENDNIAPNLYQLTNTMTSVNSMASIAKEPQVVSYLYAYAAQLEVEICRILSSNTTSSIA